jgi:hypothetical protein
MLLWARVEETSVKIGGRDGKVIIPPLLAVRGCPLAWDRVIGALGKG